MKSTYMVYVILIFGVIAAICSPNLVNMALRNDDSTYEISSDEQTISTEYNQELAVAIPEVEEDITIVKETKIEEPKKEENVEKEEIQPLEEEKNVPTQELLIDPIVYDGLTLKELTAKLDRVLKSNLSNTGRYFAKYSIEYGVDPYIALAITLHETGCNGTCSKAVKQYNNVGGMKNSGGLIKFATLEEGIKGYIYNLKKNYYSKGLTTLEQMNKKYAASSSWSKQVNRYVNMIKSA